MFGDIIEKMALTFTRITGDRRTVTKNEGYYYISPGILHDQ